MIRPTNLIFWTILRLWNLAHSIASFVELKNIISVLLLFSFKLEIDENSSIAFMIVSIFSGELVLQKHCKSSAKHVGEQEIVSSFESTFL